MAHVQEHLELWRNADPQILQILGLPPVPQQPMPMADIPANPAGSIPAQQEEPLPNQPNLPSLPDEAPPEATADFEKRTLT